MQWLVSYVQGHIAAHRGSPLEMTLFWLFKPVQLTALCLVLWAAAERWMERGSAAEAARGPGDPASTVRAEDRSPGLVELNRVVNE